MPLARNACRAAAAVLMVAVVLVAILAPSPAWANNSLGVHWARIANPFTVQIDANVDASWNAKLATAAADWAASPVVDTNINTGSFGDRNQCAATVGHVEVCNGKFGANGWTGAASVYFDASNHITRASVWLNDTYLARGSYPDAYDQLTVCQELGHALGLAHQDEDVNNPNLGTCMDYTHDADGPPSNEHPNAHDYDQLAADYAHLDSYSTYGPVAAGDHVVTFIIPAR